jgi:HSP20 family protein
VRQAAESDAVPCNTVDCRALLLLLTLSGDRREQVMTKGGEDLQGRRIERGYGHFHRRFVLPDTVDGEKVNATGKNGVLTVTIPKQAKAMPRRIQIDA